VSSVASLVDELAASRTRFLAALDALPAERRAAPVMASWTARDLVWHVAFWTEHGADAVELVIAGRGAAFDYDTAQTDAMNAAEAERGASATLEAAREREAAAFSRFVSALGRVDDAALATRLGNGDALEDVVRYDGPDHYDEHAAHLRTA
jgi:uncharacterized damage-inducible protein DinB